ncbi:MULTISPECIES: dihydrofolate reductase family protein [unclassified Paenibacillus]|uniref:dihydrofolate reductase family protein n=1 Tax=unclassified Paenibacillus TaxID=185978 RepID=UPI002404E567|nr:MULTISPECIES: dihydrofolate reductase family protein [unclassified Paenibacillus]MDF9844160.1 riboflavin biosynthesis pyrimidine reductase [Paenibacillus sp. PastF-2]MDF9850718.1 riboflavin biosynthesis pyrimidine reductase [Paenibacillus sp. PastM-2]MDF9857289.1 riboflavin biosynthesis pyrimidine reductase [Paenibacillus sp. PastF-1]MDH6482603.1 riboflavin biosynthesis pyrimidine reductase [Paenibacillus sp. PastH-2]MDH6510030.1 riboflavin biosynthesis pyrimidine reductase [Paenibacillus s
MAKVIIHATTTLDGFMADKDGGVDWMFDFEAADEDYAVVHKVMEEIGAIVGGHSGLRYSTRSRRRL